MKQIETILTDVGGVLIRNYDVTPHVRDAVELPSELFDPIWRQGVFEYGSGTITEDELFDRFARSGGKVVTAPDEVLGAPFKANLEIFRKTLSQLEALGQSGYRLAVLSDSIENHSKHLNEVYGPFQPDVYLSYQTGHRKPSEGAYEDALRRLGNPHPETVLFIDDRPANISTALNLGLRACLVPGNDSGNQDVIGSALESA